jgi:hypothetical protein
LLNIAGSTGNWTGKLDLANNDLVIDYSGSSPAADVRDQIKSGRNGGAWNGNGITSALADQHTFSLGYADNTTLGLATFSGQAVDPTSVLVKYTYYGDTNLDGKVDIQDLLALATHYNTTGDIWTSGDLNYDGAVNNVDLGLLAANWQAGVGAPLGEPLGAALTNLGLPDKGVPEPGMTVFLSAMLATLAGRKFGRTSRRRHGE